MSVRQQLRWQEPWFFSLRMRDRRGWQRKGWLIVAIFVAMMVGWYLDQRYGKGLRIGLMGAIILCLGIAVFVSSGKPFGLLILVMRASILVLGVPQRVSRSELVEFFRSHGVQEAQEPSHALRARVAAPDS